jgi:hypothetical protein
MKIYKDKDLKEEIDANTLDFGIVKAGEKQRYLFYIYNDTNGKLVDLEFFVDNKEVKIEIAPKTIEANKVEELILVWSPSVTLKQGLKGTKLSMKIGELYD